MEQYRLAEANEVLISSFLKKKGYVNTKDLLRVKQMHMKKGTPPTHTHWWWPTGDHVYWCVLRKGQFSYYKTRDEREAIDVLPRSHVLNFRVIPELIIFNLYTKDKTLSFRAESIELLGEWTRALNNFLKFEDAKGCCHEEVGGTVVSPHRRADSDGSSEDECEAAVFDTQFGLAILETNTCLQKTKIARFKEEYDDCSKDGSVIAYNNDSEFYRVFDPRNVEHVVHSGELYVKVETRFNRTRWKKFKGILTNKTFRLCSLKTGKVKREMSLDTLIDCVEVEDPVLDTFFTLVLTDERVTFCSSDDNQVVDWIVAFKGGMLARRKLYRDIDVNLG